MNPKGGILGRHPVGVALFFVAICLLPVMILRDFSPDNELRYLSIADEALSEGHLFAFYFKGVPYADKPPLYFWIIMLCKSILGKHSMFALCLFSIIPAFVIVGIMDRWVRQESPSERAAGALMMSTCALLTGMSVFLRMDMLMCMFIILALYTFYLMYEGDDRKSLPWMLAVWTFLAIFTKGPIGFLMPIVSIVTFLLVKKQGKTIGKYLGWKFWGTLAVLCIGWFLGVLADGGKGYLYELLFHQTFGRAVKAFDHGNPFWYYIPAIFYSTAPYSLLLVGIVIFAFVRGGNGSRTDKETFFVCTIASTFVMLSLFSGKLAIYMAPIYPFMVWLFPLVLERKGWKRWMDWALGIPAALLSVACIAGAVAMLFFKGKEPLHSLLTQAPYLNSPLVVAALLVIALGNAASLWTTVKGKAWPVRVLFLSGSILLGAYVASPIMTQINPYIGYAGICKGIPDDSTVATIGIRRPQSMDVYLGRDVTDYGEDFEAFEKDMLEPSDSTSGAKVTLITKRNRIGNGTPLGKFLEGCNQNYSGPYVSVTFDKGKGGTP